jgi:hypothetical protein
MSSFTPINNNTSLNDSLLGSGTLTNFEILNERPIHLSPTKQHNHLISIIILSAILFVTIVALYDVIRVLITNYYASIALLDPKSHNTLKDIDKTIVANNDRLQATFIFALICLIIALIFIPIIYVTIMS